MEEYSCLSDYSLDKSNKYCHSSLLFTYSYLIIQTNTEIIHCYSNTLTLLFKTNNPLYILISRMSTIFQFLYHFTIWSIQIIETIQDNTLVDNLIIQE